ncbi:molybdate ABC transporter substrate-binding protein [Qingshengfaniella alkalisoli]|uniref:Molybdate ABC transporter substrate-binding protein n=1 Tax=Qingshengfaniella alkalisoli TaxID=2599296 RepID=A0A5B8IVV9_9RHOB|nr:molybdate ABC transporter substrate-binding protein [Qingshengfaniella alkalisoli]QDY69011.1 molybdate ABC transporter substrate-binding protein [Qingshengfaniella alkalisoli]
MRVKSAMSWGLGFVWAVAALSASADVTVAVASNFRYPAEEIAAQFEEDTGTSVKLVFGSSGKHAAGIINGAPFDVFLSADTSRPDRLDYEGLVERRAPYAIGRIALYAPDQVDGDSARALLESGEFRKLAVADARLAPYGKAAMQALSAKQLDIPASKIVIGENIGQTFGFVFSGNAELGIVALSQIMALPEADQHGFMVIDPSLHDPIQQDAVLLTQAVSPREAAGFFDYLLSDATLPVLEKFGYTQARP